MCFFYGDIHTYECILEIVLLIAEVLSHLVHLSEDLAPSTYLSLSDALCWFEWKWLPRTHREQHY